MDKFENGVKVCAGGSAIDVYTVLIKMYMIT